MHDSIACLLSSFGCSVILQLPIGIGPEDLPLAGYLYSAH
jgi:hypothetical protein